MGHLYIQFILFQSCVIIRAVEMIMFLLRYLLMGVYSPFLIKLSNKYL